MRSSLVRPCRRTTKVAVLVPPRFTCHGFQMSMAQRLASQSRSQKLVPSEANGSRATMLTTGGTLVGGGDGGGLVCTVIWTDGEVPTAPTVSVARAFSV